MYGQYEIVMVERRGEKRMFPHVRRSSDGWITPSVTFTPHGVEIMNDAAWLSPDAEVIVNIYTMAEYQKILDEDIEDGMWMTTDEDQFNIFLLRYNGRWYDPKYMAYWGDHGPLGGYNKRRLVSKIVPLADEIRTVIESNDKKED